jgi:acetylornithine deacetylase/succinyl-diaminopimelate desuccinylase-like protein
MSNGADSLEADAVALLADLVAIPSINPAFRTPDAQAEWFGEAAMASMCVWSEIEAEVRRSAAGLDRRAAVIMHPPFLEGASMDVPREAAIIAAASAACRAEGLPDEVMGVSFGSVASAMTRAGIPTIILARAASIRPTQPTIRSRR